MITIFDEAQKLATNWMFDGLSEAKCQQLAFASERLMFQDGETIVRQGDEGDCGFLILDGAVVVTVDQDGSLKELATMGEGFVVGDHVLITGGQYKVTVRAKGSVETLQIHRDALLKLIEGDRDVMARMLSNLSERKAAAERLFSVSLD